MADLNLKLLITATNDGAIRSINQLDQSIKGVGASAKQNIADLAHISGAMALWSQVAGSPTAAIAAFARAADEIKGIEARVKLASGSLQEFNQNLAAIRATAQASGTAVASVAALFNRIATPIRDMGGSVADAQQAVASVGQALRISGASAAESSSAMLQFAQALGAGVLRGEELNSILENAPRLAQAIATGLGVTIGELKRLGEAGALTSQQVLSAVRSQQDALAEESARLPQTVGMAWTNLGEAAKKYVSEVDKAHGVTQAMAGALNGLASSLPAIVSGLEAVAVVAAVAFGANRAGAAVAKLADIEATRAKAAASLREAETAHMAAVAVREGAAANVAATATATAYAGASEVAALADERRAAAARLLAANQGVVGAASALQAAQAVNAAASTTLLGRAMAGAALAGRGLMALMGGPLGLALTAITAGVIAWEMFGSKAKKAGDETSQALAKMTAEFNEFSAKRGPQEAAKALSDLKDKAAEAREKLVSPLFRASNEGKALAADLKVADGAIEKFEQRVTKFNDQHSKERGLLGLDKLKLDTGGLVSDDMQKQLNAFSLLYKDFIGNAISDNNKLKASAVEVKAALASLLSSAKTPAEFTGLIGRLGEAIKVSPKDSTFKSQLENAIDGRMRAELKALDALVSGLEARAKRTQDFFMRAATLALGQFNQAAALSRVAAELKNDTAGGSLIDTNSRNAEVAVAQQAASLQVAALEQVAARKRDLIEQGKKDTLSAVRDEISAAGLAAREKTNQERGELAKGLITKEQFADREEKLAKETADKVRAARAAGTQAEQDAIRQTREVDADAARQRAKIAEDLYKTLQSKSAEALSQYKQYAQQVIALDKSIQNNRLDTAAAIGALQRSDMSPKEQLGSLREELAAVQAAAAEAQSAGRNDQALGLLNRQKSLASSIGGLSGEGVDKKAQIKEGSAELERIGAEADAILQEQRAAAQAAADQQLKSYGDMTTVMNELSKQITALNENAAIKLKPEIDKASLDGAIAVVQQAFSGITIPINVQAVGLPAGDQGPVVQGVTTSRAYGGPLPGSAPHDRSDNRLYWGTPGEWVIQRPAVRYYGSEFVAALNAMRLPKFAYGGQMGGSAIDRLRVPEMPGAAAPGTAARNLTLVLGNERYGVSAGDDVIGRLTDHVAREALRKGGRR